MTERVRFKNLEQYGFGPNVMRRIKICSACGQIARSASHVCRVCGEKLPRQTLFDRYKRQHTCCLDCDTVLSPDSQYCPHCGKRILR